MNQESCGRQPPECVCVFVVVVIFFPIKIQEAKKAQKALWVPLVRPFPQKMSLPLRALLLPLLRTAAWHYQELVPLQDLGNL